MAYEVIADDGVNPPMRFTFSKGELKRFMGEAIHMSVVATQKIENEYHHGDENFSVRDVPDELLLVT